MKKTVLFLLSIMFVTRCCLVPATAEFKGYSWYCPHVKNHVQPTTGGELAFAESLDAYYIDRKHTDPDSSDKVIYLTFDAGYENGNIEKILNILRDEDVPAAFFILGNLITQNTDLVRRMAEEGHIVCNHTVHHKDMTLRNDTAFLEELTALETLYREHIGKEMAHYYRPPEGRFSRENLECAKKNGYQTIFWSFAYPDWDNGKQMSPQKAKAIVMDNVHNGEVMLLHPTSATNAAILRDVIGELKVMGYRFGTLDELTRGD